MNNIGTDCFLGILYHLSITELSAMTKVNKFIRGIVNNVLDTQQKHCEIRDHYYGPYIKDLDKFYKLFNRQNEPIFHTPDTYFHTYLINPAELIFDLSKEFHRLFCVKIIGVNTFKLRILPAIILNYKNSTDEALYTTFAKSLPSEIRYIVESAIDSKEDRICTIESYVMYIENRNKINLISFQDRKNLNILKKLLYGVKILDKIRAAFQLLRREAEKGPYRHYL